MAFFKSLKSAFGLVDDDDDQIITDDPEGPAAPSLPDADSTDTPVDPSADVDRIFEHVVNVFNESLPSFLKAGVNAEAQRRHLYDTLDADIRAHFSVLEQQTQARCEQRWLADKEDLKSKMRQLEIQNKDIEDKRLELSQKQLSADRQKRALSERVHDLEKQVAKLDADREQYDLENKSLINKLKVAGVFEKENEQLRAELNERQAEILKLRSQGTAHSADDSSADKDEKSLAERDEEITRLKTLLKQRDEELSRATDAVQNAEKEALESAVKVEDLEKQTAVLTEKITAMENAENASAQDAQNLADEVSHARRQIKQLAEERDSLKKQLEDMLARAAEMPSPDQIEILRQKAAEAEELTAQFSSIEAQITRFQNIKAAKDDQIASLKTELAQSRASELKLKNQLADARKTTDRASDSRDNSSDITGKNSTRQQTKNSRPHKQRHETSIDDILSDTDWLVTPSSANKPSNKTRDRRDNRHEPDSNDSQLSLF